MENRHFFRPYSIVRAEYFLKRKEYSSIKKLKKDTFFSELTSDIKSGTNINWARFKKLKKRQQSDSKLDAFDMMNFCKFLKILHGNNTLSEEKINALKEEMFKKGREDETLENELDQEITVSELQEEIDNCKTGKAVSEDLLANEFIYSNVCSILRF